MRGVLLALAIQAPQDDPFSPEVLRERLKDPRETWAVFRDLVRAREYGKAHELLSAETRKALPYEAFVIAFTAFDASRRLVAAGEAHGYDPASGRLRLCNPEFGIGRDLKVAKFVTIHVLDFSRDDLEYFKGRALSWYRHQVKRADGWHFAYPPDWTYAPLARTCDCGR
jgi:hypothetical protein